MAEIDEEKRRNARLRSHMGKDVVWNSMVRRGWSIKQGHGRGEVRLDVSLESQAKVLELNLEDMRGIDVNRNSPIQSAA